jgi:hypothetical protein
MGKCLKYIEYLTKDFEQFIVVLSMRMSPFAM